MTTAAPTRTRQPLAVWMVAVVLPLIVSAAFVAVQFAWLPSLPDPIAVHWGADGPDGFGPAWSTIALTAGLALGLTAMFAAFLALGRGPAPTATHKLLAVLSLSVAVFIGIAVTASLGVQRGLDDARDAPQLGGWLGVALGGALLVAVAAWFALPKAVRRDADATPAEPLPLVPGERSVWIATTRLSTGATVTIAAAIGFTIAVTVFAIVLSDGLVWPLVAVPVLLLAMCAIGTVWRARVDAGGLTVRSAPFGWPRVRIPVDEVAAVTTGHVEPLSDFGGWGWRWAPGGGFGVVSRSGEAIQVTRRDGRRFVVTVDDAETGAALLAAYAGIAR
ncbi:DUF1648 domain-containing protein [Protaetiibacter intestinalis]|uniref:DUF1648 domain-containing protein n=1 Tax=Protaetiibacter intestinalis TaxID=2419774 RepID=A0A387B3S7_9MICO|nr:DUF1648 domain-containing protein [Protaetiibacter intestinalis]AYF96967.1 DUF1648 domain-containing protein [Protaetiibacter intestinalis]